MSKKAKKVKKDKKDMTLKDKIVENINVFLSAYLIAFVIRLFIIEAYQIPTQSMVPNLLVRDILMVQKISYGTVLPIFNGKIPGVSKPKKDDIIVFITPQWESPGVGKELITLLTLSLVNLDNTLLSPKNLVKRVVGEPGDTISMSNKTLTINGEILEMQYISAVRQKIFNQWNNYGYNYFNLYTEETSNYSRIVQHIQRSDFSNPIPMEVFYRDDFIPNFESRYIRYLVETFPEIKVPKKDDIVDLVNINNYYKYLLKKLIEDETGNVLTYADGYLYLDEEKLTEWEIKQNYYFAMGDNRDNSEDGRYFGFIPEKNIFGKILFRYFPFKRFAFRVDEIPESVIKLDFN